MGVLFISWWWPYPASNGSKIRIYNLLRHLASAHEVYLLSFAEAGEATPEQLAHMRTFCAHVEAIPRPQSQYHPTKIKTLLGFFSPWPRWLMDAYSPVMAERVLALVQSAGINSIVASQIETMRYLDLTSLPVSVLEEFQITAFYDQFAHARNVLARLRAWFLLNKFEKLLKRRIEQGTVVTVVSEQEKAYLQQFVTDSSRLVVIPNGVDTAVNRPGASPPAPNTLIYSGAVTFDANYDAVRYFICDVLPLVRQQIPDVQFTVTGGTGKVDVSDLSAQPGVTFTGFLPEVAPAVQASWAAVVPLREGGGTRLKILEAMALGTPVISTRKGAEGLNVRNAENILLADTPQELAQAVVTLLRDAAFRERLAQAGRALVEREYDWSVIARRLIELIANNPKGN